jgi:hypothetical protein
MGSSDRGPDDREVRDAEVVEALRVIEELDPERGRRWILAILAGSHKELDQLLTRKREFSRTDSREHLKTG